MMTCKYKPVFFIQFLFLGGCVVGPDFVPPKVEVAESFLASSEKDVSSSSEKKLLFEGTSPSNSWWTGFKDPLLESLLKDVRQSNKSLAAAYARLLQAQGVYQEGRTGIYPTVSLGAGYRDSKNSEAGFQGPSSGSREQKLFDSTVSAIWELDFFGRVRREIEARRASEDAAASSLVDLQRIMLADTTAAYVELRGAQKKLEILRKNADLQKKTVELTQRQLDAGKVTKLDLMRAKTQYHMTISAVPTAEDKVRSLALSIAVLAGKEPNDVVPLLEQSAPLPEYNGPIAIGDPANLIRNRPDVAAAESKLHALTAKIGFEVGEMFPKVSFNGNLGLEGKTPRDFEESGAFKYLIAPSISWRLFEFRRLSERVQTAEAAAAESLANFEQIVLQALQDVEGALSNYAKERQRRADLREAFKASREAYELAQMQYSNGAIDLLALLDTQRQLLAAEDSLIDSDTKSLTSLVRVFKSLGGRWEV